MLSKLTQDIFDGQRFKEACDDNYPDNIYFSKEWVKSGLF